MKLPNLDQPGRYSGLYVFDFGEWSAVGYTADEVAILLEDPNYAAGRVYRIHRATPDGRLELQGVSSERFRAESAMLFSFDDESAARAAFAELIAGAERAAPPCRVAVQLADRGFAAEPWRYALALLLPAEYEQEVGDWLSRLDFQAGDHVEGGISVATGYAAERPRVLERKQLWSEKSAQSRSHAEVLASVRRAVQR